MQLLNSSKRPIVLAACLLLSGAYVVGPSAQAWPSIPNPFAKKTNAEDVKAPPGMTDIEDPTNSPTDKTLGRDETQDDAEKIERNVHSGPPDERIDIIGNDPQLHVKLAKQAINRKAYAEALVQVNTALKLNKDEWEARYLGAYIYQLQGRTAEAAERYKQFLLAKPENQQAHINLGVMLRQLGKLDEAEDEYRQAIDLHYYSLQAHYDLANLLIAREKMEEALKELRACEKIAPNSAWVHNNLGVIYQRRDYLEEAQQEFNRAANLEPANKTFAQNLVMVEDQISHKKEANLPGSHL